MPYRPLYLLRTLPNGCVIARSPKVGRAAVALVDGGHRHVLARLVFGPVEGGRNVLRTCSTPGCLRPDHLRLRKPPPEPRPRRQRTHCLRGHLFDEANTHVGSDGRRTCRACLRERQRARRARLREAELCAR